MATIPPIDAAALPKARRGQRELPHGGVFSFAYGR
jgi:hypothetical protein